MLVFDRPHFDRMTGGDRALQLEVLKLFRAQVDAWTVRFSAGEGWRDAVHTLKGSARGIGLSSLAAACEAAEKASDDTHAAAMAEVRMRLDEALAELTRFAAAA